MRARIRCAALIVCLGAGHAAPALAQSGFRPPPADAAAEPSVTELVSGEVEIGSAEPAADAPVEAGALAGGPVVRPVRVDAPPTIDGRLDDAAWLGATHISEFVQLQPLDGAPATESTDVYLAYDSTSIYLGIRARYSAPSMIRANRSDLDTTFRVDLVNVYFDTFLDQQRAYVFTVNAYGVQGDSIVSARGGGGGFNRRRGGGGGGLPRGDDSWDALFTTGGRMVDDGFTAEMAIPFKSLRYPQRGGAAPHRWGLQIARRIAGKDETVVWSPVSRAVAGFLPQMGVLEGMAGLSTSRNIEILQTFTTIQFGSLDAASGDFVNRIAAP